MSDAISATPRLAKPKRRNRMALIQAVEGYVFSLPTIIGLVVFSIGPIFASLYLSFTNYDIVNPPTVIGLANYSRLLTTDPYVGKSLAITAYYSLVSVPLGLLTGFLVALLMNQRVKGIVLYRAVWYIPSLVPTVSLAVLWRWLLNRDFGLLNVGLGFLGIRGPGWLIDPKWTVPSLIVISLWGVGGSMLINLAALQGVPTHLYEAVEVDGGNWWHKFRSVTIPMVSPVIFFNLIMGIIGSFQSFTLVYVIFQTTSGTSAAGPENAALFYLLYLYRNAFQYFQMGYASALAWVLFIIILVLTWVAFKLSGRWVYYESAVGG